MSVKRKLNPLPSRIDFIAMEKKWLDHWYKKGIVAKYLKKNKDAAERFSFLDGPITANNPMGIHHAWGRTYKDLWQRYYNMRGKRQRFQNGFDCQGLWVEVEVEKELGLKSKRDIENLMPGDTFASLAKFVNLCKERVRKFAAIQTEQSKRLGYFMDWDNSYYTMSDENNYHIWHYLKRCHEKGWLYKGRDSVPWCPRCGTAISQHEILTEEYRELTHRTVVFKLPIKGRTNEYLLAWTTTPWTIPGNMALVVDPKLSYWEMAKNGETIYVVNPKARTDSAKEVTLVHRLGLTEGWKKTREHPGSSLVGLVYEAPYADLPAVKKARSSSPYRVVETDPKILPVNPAEGTGIVHVAPGAGGEDYQLGLKHTLPVVEEIDESGTFLEGFGFLSNLPVAQASSAIIEDLGKRDLAQKVADYTHRYPTCWRCNTELVWRVVDEWYIAMDRKDPDDLRKRTYRRQMQDVAQTIHWIPSWGLDRELDWLKNMHDWLISKKRYWGLALPIFECDTCGAFEVIGSKEELKKRAVSGWDAFEGNSPHRPWVDQVTIRCTTCDRVVSRIPDVGNPWLDAGIVPFSTLNYLPDREYWKQWFPADFVTEAFPGQFKNWFYALIAMSTVLKQQAPFANLLGHAQVRDETGEEMHKSKGNAIEFNEAAEKAGADIIRWLYALQNPELNVNFGFATTDEIRRRWYLIFWNSVRFFCEYAAADTWTPQESRPDIEKLSVLDRWILAELADTIAFATSSLDTFDAQSAAKRLERFVTDLSTWYIRRSRDRVGPTATEEGRDQCYHVLYLVLQTLCKLLAPFTPFIAEEAYVHITGQESVHLSDWPSALDQYKDQDLSRAMAQVRAIVELGHAIRKDQGINLRQPLARLYLLLPKSTLPIALCDLIRDELNVKEVMLLKKESRISSALPKKQKAGMLVALDCQITDTLREEGEARSLIRQIQEARRHAGMRINEWADVTVPHVPARFMQEIRKKTLARSLTQGDKFSVVPAG